MAKQTSKSIAQVKINCQTYSIRASIHAIERMQQRNVDEYVVVGNVIALGPERLLEYQSKEADVMILDEAKKVAIVFAFNGNKVMIVTVIDKADCYAKRGTEVVKL